MNLWPFKKKGTEQPGEEAKEEWFSEAMPLIEIAHVQDRIAHYQEAFQALTGSTADRTHDMAGGIMPDIPVTEYRFVLDLHQIDPVRQPAALHAIALTTGSLNFYPASYLQTKGWDTDGIVGAIPAEEVGALRLDVNDYFSSYWVNYLPGKVPITVESLWYFNIEVGSLGVYIKPLIEKYVKPKVAELLIASSGVPPTGNWVDDYFQAFLTASENLSVSVPVAGGDILAQLGADNRLSPDGQHFRLSMFFLMESFEDATDLAKFFEYRQRLPAFTELSTALLEEKSMAGHPLISFFTGLPIDSARVDFVDQEIYSTKNVNELWLDPDSHPYGIVLQKAPPADLRTTAETMGVDLTDHGTSYFKLYNPDQLALSLRDPDGVLALSQTQVGPDEWQPLISVAATAPLPVPAYLEVLGPASDVVKKIEVFEFDFKLFPVCFWYLDPLQPNDYQFEEIFASMNRVLGRQANVFGYPAISIGNDARNQVLSVNGIQNQNQPIGLTLGAFALFQDTLAATEVEVHDLNVIFTWKLLLTGGSVNEIYPNGATITSAENDERPAILVDITKNDPSHVGSTVAHEIGHWIGHFIMNNTDAEEFDHHMPDDHAQDSGSTLYRYNLMSLGRHRDDISLTRRQAELINQGVGNLI